MSICYLIMLSWKSLNFVYDVPYLSITITIYTIVIYTTIKLRKVCIPQHVKLICYVLSSTLNSISLNACILSIKFFHISPTLQSHLCSSPHPKFTLNFLAFLPLCVAFSRSALPTCPAPTQSYIFQYLHQMPPSTEKLFSHQNSSLPPRYFLSSLTLTLCFT